MTKDELIGRKFKLSKSTDIDEYTIYKAVGDNLWVNWPSDKVGIDYPYSIILEKLRTDNWILLPEEKKMYKTPKGIEYGVGNQFTASNGEIYVINKVEDNKFYYKNIRNEFGETSVGLEFASKNMLDEGNWVIITPMKDYKQVDPKTITFDFTNTKIKVNNEDESKWVLEVMKANKMPLQSPEHEADYIKRAIELICYNHYVLYRDTTYSNNDNKEITIQDILNNMKEVIEVGDVVEILSSYKAGTNAKIINKQANGNFDVEHYNKLTYRDEYEKTTGYEPKMLKLVSKGKKKVIIGYETVIDLPGIPKGSKSNIVKGVQRGQFMFGEAGNIVYYSDVQVSDTKFFKPIYKQDSIELKFSKYTATLNKENGLVFSDSEKIKYQELSSLLISLSRTSLELPAKYSGHKVVVGYQTTEVLVGCKSFTTNDLKIAQDAIKKLDE